MKTLIIIDGHALAYRHFFALERTGMKTSNGQPTWAVYGFFKTIFDLLKNKNLKPDAIIVAFDVSKENFRTEKYEDYKANREAMPDNMICQMNLIKKGLEAFSIPIYTKQGYEADDVIGTITTKTKNQGNKVYILTGDQDSFQLIDKEGLVKVLVAQRGVITEYDWDKVYEKLGVYPNQIVDYKSLRGDASDNIPGIKGIGQVTAEKLLQKYGNLENIIANVQEIQNLPVRGKIRNGVEKAHLSKFLATIVTDLDIDFDIEKNCIQMPDIYKVTGFLQDLQFHSFIKKISEILNTFSNSCQNTSSSDNNIQLDLFTDTTAIKIMQQNCEFEKKLYDYNNIEELLSILKTNDLTSFVVHTSDVNEDAITDVAFAIKENDVIKVFPISIDENIKKTLNILKPFFEDANINKITHDIKHAYRTLINYGIELQGATFDTMLASYIKNPSRQHAISIQAMENLKFMISGENKICEEAYIIHKLKDIWESKLTKEEKKLLYETEIPLAYVLAKMETTGVSIDTEYLHNLTLEYIYKLKENEDKAFENANGIHFNINSHKQVSDVLFNRLKYKHPNGPGRKSTSAEILETLSKKHPVCNYILEYRKYAKLRSTYTEVIPKLISPKDGKLHTHFNQAVTTTGRLSSTNPNLQNIPTGNEDAKKLRKAFITENENNILISADYSQIELRLLAHICNDEIMIKAFNENKDIHTDTASKIFNVPIEKVTKDMRQKAKAVNFGIVYGQGKYGLSKAINIDVIEAEKFINKYFETYSSIKDYMNKTKEFAYSEGYVETLYGRKRYLKMDLNSSNWHIREAAERAAINQPIQGSAADLIKMAMVHLDGVLTKLKLQTKIILQVHDELILEAPKQELEIAQKLVREAMELNQPLKVPLVVDIACGKNWSEL